MAKTTVNLSIPFEVLLDSTRALDLDSKVRLLEALEEELAQIEGWEEREEVRAARAAYEAGDVLTIDDYMAQSETRAMRSLFQNLFKNNLIDCHNL